jgi:hypothetical protein
LEYLESVPVREKNKVQVAHPVTREPHPTVIAASKLTAKVGKLATNLELLPTGLGTHRALFTILENCFREWTLSANPVVNHRPAILAT